MRNFSFRCGECGEPGVTVVTIPYTVQIVHDGREHMVTVPNLTVPKCQNCGTVAISRAADRQIDLAFRAQAGLLTGAKIREQRLALKMTQQELADRLAINVSTLSRWETGAQIQQRCLDLFLRAYFQLPEIRSFLATGV